MTLPEKLWEQVRRRTNECCEYCGVTETDSAGPLTVDHFRPRARGGTDDLDNLLYGCWRCNGYKADYWPERPADPALWNPGKEPATVHLVLLADATLHPLTSTGAFTIKQLRLNRPALVAYRLQRQRQSEDSRLLEQFRAVVNAQADLQRQHTLLLEEHRAVLEELRVLLRLLLPPEN